MAWSIDELRMYIMTGSELTIMNATLQLFMNI